MRLPDMAHLIRFEARDSHRYRIVQTGRGFVMSFTVADEAGLPLDPQEWVYKTREAAERGLDLVVLMNAWWDAAVSGCPAGDLPDRCERAASEHARAVERLGDRPLVGAVSLAPEPPPDE